MTSALREPNIYRAVIDDVIASIKPEFDEYGVSEDVLHDLQDVSVPYCSRLVFATCRFAEMGEESHRFTCSRVRYFNPCGPRRSPASNSPCLPSAPHARTSCSGRTESVSSSGLSRPACAPATGWATGQI